MKFDIITAFPNAFSFLDESIPKRAKEKGIIDINIVDLRGYGLGKWKKIDDRPFGGGEGMVLSFEPIYRALKDLDVYPKDKNSNTKILLMSAKGNTWSQESATQFSAELDRVVLICGHYEGVDNRVVEELIDEEISIGNYILSGGELAATVIIDSIIRLLPGALGNEMSKEIETSFTEDSKISEAPSYTRPEEFTTDEGKILSVPKVLLGGNHAEIEKWKQENSKISNSK